MESIESFIPTDTPAPIGGFSKSPQPQQDAVTPPPPPTPFRHHCMLFGNSIAPYHLTTAFQSLSSGLATSKDPVMIDMKQASGALLLSRVQNILRPPIEMDKVRSCVGGASSLAYLEALQIIQRDIAARNCLLSAEDEVKLSDFGLSLLGIKYRERSMKNVPIRSLSPETVEGRFPSKTDVWSYGVSIWEIYSSNRESSNEFRDNIEIRRGNIEQRLKLLASPGVPRKMQLIILSCLIHEPERHPTFWNWTGS